MTTQEFDALKDRAVDALIAEKVMGSGPFPWNIGNPIMAQLEEKIPYYSTDLNACRSMEETIKGSDHEEGYCYALEGRYWEMLHATARQKCKAALMAVGIINDTVAASGKEDVG